MLAATTATPASWRTVPPQTPPGRMLCFRPEEDPDEGAGEGKDPVDRSPGEHSRRPADQVGEDDECLLGEEDDADRAVGLQIEVQERVGEHRGTGGSDQVDARPDEPLGERCPGNPGPDPSKAQDTGRSEIHPRKSSPPGARFRRPVSRFQLRGDSGVRTPLVRALP